MKLIIKNKNMGILERISQPKSKEEQEKPKHWREIAEEEEEEEEEVEKLGRVLKELPEEREEEKEEQEKPKHWREIAEEEREEDEEEKAMMRVIKETPEEKLERLEQNLEKKEKQYKKLKSIRTFFGLLKTEEEKTEIEKEYEEAKKKTEEARKKYITEEAGGEGEKEKASFDLIDITRKQYLQAVERKWPEYKIGSLKGKYQDLINKLAEAEKEKRIEAEREELEAASIKKEDIDYILQTNGQKTAIKKEAKDEAQDNKKKKLDNMFGKGLRESYHNA